ncbi:uncharacterized protein POS17_2718 [Pseudomonas sp. Os17]|uniref:hypothetical protein n=1 Tax=Pseudomonas sp. Os17 TaxID=1500686 RepID=UPI0005FC7B47|nr:hypothetical protein [Pseudomonas sp. Os17]BAQ74412.1 uncharacterized protein POS17_2718 [Pseudomonas sp. Os17]
MHFTSSVLPGVRAFAATMRVRLCREPKVLARSPFSSCVPTASTALRANWRVCPMTGQLQQRWSLDDSQDPQSRGAALLRQAGLIFGLYLGARTSA